MRARGGCYFHILPQRLQAQSAVHGSVSQRLPSRRRPRHAKRSFAPHWRYQTEVGNEEEPVITVSGQTRSGHGAAPFQHRVRH